MHDYGQSNCKIDDSIPKTIQNQIQLSMLNIKKDKLVSIFFVVNWRMVKLTTQDAPLDKLASSPCNQKM